ncbi:MAG: hypothetical protein U1E42_11825 [Rhodospirillales bacterium]
MFKRERYIVAVNKALAELGAARAFNSTYRRGMMLAGLHAGLTPQELAVLMVRQYPSVISLITMN